MAKLLDLLTRNSTPGARLSWPHITADDALWQDLTEQLPEGAVTLLGLWGDNRESGAVVRVAVIDEARRIGAVVTHECPGGQYPALSKAHPPAMRLERTVHDLFGLLPIGLPDTRPWLDHGMWPVRHPLGDRTPSPGSAPPYPFLSAQGEGLHQIPVGPVHAGVIEPGHFRFTAGGETVVRLEERLGYTHKGVEGLMIGADLKRAAQLAGRVSGDSTVTYALAFSRAVEAVHDVMVPARAVWLRALMAELERLANHFGDIGAICNDAAFALMHAHCGVLRERVLRTAMNCFGHRLMMDRIIPGGVANDLSGDGEVALSGLLAEIRRGFPALVELYDNTASLQDRTVGTGIVDPALARQYGCGGFIGRASGRSFDTRRVLPYPPYDELRFEIPVLSDGDVNARVWIRIREVEQSLSLIDQILERLPSGPVRVEPSRARAGEAIALVEGFRGDILVWVSLDGQGLVRRCHLRDPSWFQWPLLEAAIDGNIVADFPLCNKSFNCSYSGHDL
ncbi:NADH-quinone oxidoreductase subunit C [Labrys sp. LIt4]|uniref:hydrogenase large subunit n=1 Tax=Labrys sp. LIt4 TaxID=2821355 RepID=UPI001AE0A18F|nr:NADH-quinone oxidoreductase subunit C [Labrys sp. LIt4]MBP0583412.1 NADH-quinone oxidoreductase subunit C [Labrys sp. LIt4]